MCPVILTGVPISATSTKKKKRLYFLTCLKRAGVEENDLVEYDIRIIRSVIEYACPVWSTSLTQCHLSNLEQIQKRAMHIIYPDISYTDAMTKSKLVSIKDRLNHLNRKIINNESHRLHYLLPNPLKKRNLRNTNKFKPPKCRTKLFKTSFIPYAL